MAPRPSTDGLPWDLRRSMEKLLKSREYAASIAGDEAAIYAKPSQRLRMAMDQVLDVGQYVELDALLRSPYVKPSEALRTALDQTIGDGKDGAWDLLFQELRAAIWESAALTKTIELVQSLLGPHGVSARKGSCTPLSSGTCTPPFLEPDSEPISSHASPCNRRLSGATASRRNSARRRRTLQAHAPRGDPTRRASQVRSVANECAIVGTAPADGCLPASTIVDSDRLKTSSQLSSQDTQSRFEAGIDSALQMSSSFFQSVCDASFSNIVDDVSEQAEDIDEDLIEFEQVVDQMASKDASSRLPNRAKPLHAGLDQETAKQSDRARREADEEAHMNELVNRIRAAGENEEKRKRDLLESSRWKEQEDQYARQQKEEALARQREQEAAAACQKETHAAMERARKCFRESLDELVRSVDMGSNESIFSAKERIASALLEAKRNGLPDSEMQDAAVLKCRLERVCISNMLEACRSVDMNSIGALREVKENLTLDIRAGLDHGISETDLAEAETWRRKIHNRIEDIKGSIRVFCRVRPLNNKEHKDGDTSIVHQVDSMTLEIERGVPRLQRSRSSSRCTPRGSAVDCDRSLSDQCSFEVEVSQFRFDSVFAPASQHEVFEDCCDLMQSAFDGYNVTIFAYGQTGAGKTFTMTGRPDQPGLAPQMINEIFRIVDKDSRRFSHRISTSMVELYRNELVDLLQRSQFAPPAKRASMHMDKDGAVHFANVIEEEVDDQESLTEVFERGGLFRKTAATAMNSESSRSHLIHTIKICRTNLHTGQASTGKIVLVDLAGSERLKKSMVTGEMMKDSIEINKSLTALGDVIEALTQGHPTVPYRNHKLTQLLQDALGRTAKTLMFVHCSPARSNLEETLATLKYATRAKKIKRTVTPRGNSMRVH